MKPYIIHLLQYKSVYLGDKETEAKDRDEKDWAWELNSNFIVVYGNTPEEAVNKYVKETKYVGTFLVVSPTETETQVVLVSPTEESEPSETVS